MAGKARSLASERSSAACFASTCACIAAAFDCCTNRWCSRRSFFSCSRALILRHFWEASLLASLASLPGLEHERENICTRESTDDQPTEQALECNRVAGLRTCGWSLSSTRSAVPSEWIGSTTAAPVAIATPPRALDEKHAVRGMDGGRAGIGNAPTRRARPEEATWHAA